LEVNDENKIIDDVQTVDQPKAGMLYSKLHNRKIYTTHNRKLHNTQQERKRGKYTSQ
jgi:hypothetical protein